MNLTAAIKATFGRFGYDVRRLPMGTSDVAQQRLLAGVQVQTVFDVGANLGTTVARYRAAFPAATIHAFEPHPDCHKQLALTFGEDEHVQTHATALGAYAGATTFHAHEWHTFSSTLAPAATMRVHRPDVPESAAEIEVPITTVDQFCEERGIGRINLLKLDVQGGELNVLRGAHSLISTHAVDLIYTEVSFLEMYEEQALVNHLMTWLQEEGYSLYGLYNFNVARSGALNQADAIFLSPARMPS